MENTIDSTPNTFPNQTSENSPSRKSFKTPLLFGLSALIFVILGLVGGYFLFAPKDSNKHTSVTPTIAPSPTPDETANWKTYHDPEHEFSFKYPSEYAILGRDNTSILGKYITFTKTKQVPNYCIGDCPNQKKSDFVTIGENTFNMVTGETGSVGGNTPQSFIQYTIKIPTNNDDYIDFTVWELPRDIDYSEIEKQYPVTRAVQPISAANKKQIEQILSTFKFTNSSDETANWKNYRNSTLGFGLKYPSDYSVKESDDHHSVTFSTDYFGDLTVSQSKYNLNSLVTCKDDNSVYPCIAKDSGIRSTTLDQKQAKTFELYKGVGHLYYAVIQTTDKPDIILEMNISGGGLQDGFNKIVSTFKFTN